MRGYCLNGVTAIGSEMTVDISQPFFAHGAGLFETLRVHYGQPVFLSEHVARMQQGAADLRISCPVDEKGVEEQILSLTEAVGLTEARIRINLLMRSDETCDVLITADSVPKFCELGPAEAVGLCDERFNGRLAIGGLKTINYMANRMAHRDGVERGYDEVLFTLEDGSVLEGTRSTVFMVTKGVLVTPPISLGILPGVTRGAILKIAQEVGIRTDPRSITWDELSACDEAFLTGSVSGVRAISRVGRVVVPSNPGPVTQALAVAYTQMIEDSVRA